ncbi:flavodoxin family protein [Microbacterium protaetiae]|uniref:Flavodoxin family protein n=1 Tax=Microbacterium protaetiae TaxID=2509458 RepID=A0A4P6ECF2_9MICO|nr:NAD(P)H-dependent oxidoreductase [Microbacterium protaetiae]QAY59910.1 flavodoxin family protein [Microbacterium protaetiae]
MTLFRLDASVFPDRSASRELADIVEAQWTAAHPGEAIVRRDIGTKHLPANMWAEAVVGQQLSQADRSPVQQAAVELAATLADELLGADALLLAVPLYNYGVSQHMKAWFDILFTDPRIQEGGAELRSRPALLVTVTGGNYGPGTPKEGWDHSTGWLQRVLADVLGLDLTIVQRRFTLVGVNPALDRFIDMAAEMHEEALRAAELEGRRFAERALEVSQR